MRIRPTIRLRLTALYGALFGVTSGSRVTLSYANNLIYLYMGGFLIAVAM